MNSHMVGPNIRCSIAPPYSSTEFLNNLYAKYHDTK